MTNTQRAGSARRKLTIALAGAVAVGAVSVLSAPSADAVIVNMTVPNILPVQGCTYTLYATSIAPLSPVTFLDNGVVIGTVTPTSSPQTVSVQWTPTGIGIHQVQALDAVGINGVTTFVNDGSLGTGSAGSASGLGSAGISGATGSGSPSGTLSGGGNTGGGTCGSGISLSS